MMAENKKMILRNKDGKSDKGIFPMTREYVQYLIDLYNCPDEFLNKKALKQKCEYFHGKEHTRVELPEIYQPTIIENLEIIIERLRESNDTEFVIIRQELERIYEKIKIELPEGV